jgi:hypothetical protein
MEPFFKQFEYFDVLCFFQYEILILCLTLTALTMAIEQPKYQRWL